MLFSRDYLKRLAARSEKLDGFDGLARKALNEREFRYKEWRAWKPAPVPPTPTRTGRWLRSKPKDPAPPESTVADAYNRAGQRRTTT